MATQFQQFRLSLLLREQRDAFAPADVSRLAYLTHVFSEEIAFEHRLSKLHYTPKEISGGLIGGQVGRQLLIEESKPPSEGFADASHLGWRAAIVVLDPTDHVDGQKLSFQYDARIGQPLAVAQSLVDAINRDNPLTPYNIEVQPIFDGGSFWRFAEENAGRVTSVTFELTVPNGLWSANDTMRDELAHLKETLNPEKVTTTFKNDSGLNTDAPNVHEAVEYAEKGSGRVKAKAKGRKSFDSHSKPRTVEVPSEAEEPKDSILAKAMNLLSKADRR